MQALIWKESFNTGIDEIDSEHQTLLQCLNECSTLSPLTVSDTTVQDLINILMLYVASHFRTEEAFMKSINFPDLELQIQQHRLLSEQVEQIGKAFASGEKQLVTSLAALLRDWFVRHILEEDKRIGTFMASAQFHQSQGEETEPAQ